MNIFYLDEDLDICARYHCDKHVVKMPTEYAQLLSSAVRISGIDAGYSLSHQNHPHAIWARSSLDNWLWLRELSIILGEEYFHRYGQFKNHRHKAIEECAKNLPLPNIPSLGLTEIPQCMPEKYKIPGDPIQAYRNYYIHEKAPFAIWTHREIPLFMK